ncbi:hypothetical protein E2R51_18850 [Jeotgalibacillus sp. S-D1]|uniref:hypothetical protein n=1 Tax=Jeotgalibacillus sp. S-D1 TaxID=2552189 RepID=UPI00105A916D|nr:hypothetical protein [Jeotgalibacillus sp. S-D1]TDL30359.1 hypothetical protein E2R51_18850 [Jeotgalibacillus sp. S-D1]
MDKDIMKKPSVLADRMNQFLLQLGTRKEKRDDILRTVLKEEGAEEIVICFQKAYKLVSDLNEKPAVEESGKILLHPEDRQLHALILSLPLQARTALILSRFHQVEMQDIAVVMNTTPSDAEICLEDAEEKLINELHELDGQCFTNNELRRLLTFLLHSYKTIKYSDGIVKPADEKTVKPEAGKQDSEEFRFKEQEKPSSKWPLAAAGGFMLLAIGAALLNNPTPTVQDNEIAQAEEEKIDKHAQEQLDDLSAQLGLSFAETSNLTYVQKAMYIYTAKQDEEELDELLVTPLQFLNKQPEIQGIKNELDMTFQSLATAEEYLLLAQEVQAAYENKLEAYTEELEKFEEADISQFSFSPEASSLLKKIEGNGYNAVADLKHKTFSVAIGGNAFEEAAREKLVPAYYDYVDELKNFPYIKDGHSQLSVEEASVKLFQMEDKLKNMVDDFSWENKWLVEYEQLLSYVIKGTAKEPVFTEDGELKEEVKAVWEQAISGDKPGTYGTSRTIRFYYNELEKHDFKRFDQWKSLTASIKDVSIMRSLMRTPDLTGLDPELNEIYHLYNQSDDDREISQLNPVQIAKLYFHALRYDDYETMYHLTASKKERPSMEAFVENSKQQREEYPDISTMTEIVEEGRDKGIVTLRVSFSEGEDISLSLKEEGIVWKVLNFPLKKDN